MTKSVGIKGTGFGGRDQRVYFGFLKRFLRHTADFTAAGRRRLEISKIGNRRWKMVGRLGLQGETVALCLIEVADDVGEEEVVDCEESEDWGTGGGE